MAMANSQSPEDGQDRKRADKRDYKRRRLSQTSASPVDEENDVQDSDPNTSENKTLNRLNKNIKHYESRLKKDVHRLEKFERALTKARDQNNKDDERKCRKYQVKYKHKVDELKSKLAECEKKRYGQLMREKEKKRPQQADVQAAAPQVIKLPYPVLNDKRDKNTIFCTLETKLNEVMRKESVNRGNISALHKQLRSCVSSERRSVQVQLDKLKQLDTNYESQREKLLKQLDYIRLSLNLDEIRGRVSLTGVYTDYDMHMMAKINQEITEMVNFMKHENRSYLCNQKAAVAATERERETTPPTTVAVPESPSKLMKPSYQSVCKALVAVLAHTAACAHATAAINAYSQSYYAYMQKQQQQQRRTSRKKAAAAAKRKPPPVPLRKELENASHTFENYKSKISRLFKHSKKLDALTNKQTSELTGLNKLVCGDYGGDSDEEKMSSSDQVATIKQEMEMVEKKIESAPPTVVAESDRDDDDEKEDDSWQTDLNYTCDLEIVMASEAKTSSSRNYLLPSLKASYFPLKASLDYPSVFGHVYHHADAVASERSHSTLTLMGRSGTSIVKADQSLVHILYSS